MRPFSQAALEGLATCAFHGNEYEAAARYCTKLVEFTPDHFERWFNLGVAEQKCGRLEQAAKAYSEAVRVRPDAKQAHVNLGIVRQ
jgi:Flp pilus assembly protein TadD